MESSPDTIQQQLESLIQWREGYRVILEAKHQKEREMLETRELFVVETETKDLRDDNTTNVSQNDSGPDLSKQTSGYSTDYKLEVFNMNKKDSQNAPRKFLKRGEGIKQRFKVSPDAFSLNKLPPYKFANAHPNLRKQTKNPTKPKPFKEKMVVPTKTVNTTEKEKTKLDIQDQNFQRLFMESKTLANSTPESKSFAKSASNVSVAAKSTGSGQAFDESKPRSSVTSLSYHSNSSVPMSIAWSKVLDPLNIKPISVAELRAQSSQAKPVQELDETDDENLNLFELLEEKAKEGSFNMNSSVIKRVLSKKSTKQKKDDEQDSDIIPIPVEIRDAEILPKITVNIDLDSSDSDSQNESDDSSDNEENKAQDQTDDKTNEVDENDSEMKSDSNRLRVRFVEEGDPTLAEETTIGTEGDDTLNGMNTELLFEHAKDVLWNAIAQNQKNMSEATFSNNALLSADDIKQLAEQSKKRLEELERQIEMMKRNNVELVRAKKEHELEKASFIQQQEEALEQINDEKVKIEMQLHDERMKIEEERRRLEEKLRMQKASIVSTERKEISKLKEEITALRTKLRDKEQAHISAQGRLRSQIRCFEKEQKDLYAEIDSLKKENKRLEKINDKLTREQNITMLNEINRNIVKLAGSKSNTQVCSEIVPPTTKSKVKPKTISSQVDQKKAESSKEVEKTIKVTKRTFTNLMSSIDTKTVSEDEDEADEAPSCDPVTIITDDSQSVSATTALSENTMNNNTQTSDANANSFKVLTRETITEDGGKEILYPNGTLRKDSGDGMTVRIMYFNGDVKETNVDEGTIKYYYSKTNTWHTTYLDGLEILEFPNGQVEHRHPNGNIEIHFPNNSVKIVDSEDKEKSAEWRFHDGTILQEMRNGDRLLIMSNGQKELHTKDFKRREYPDGTIKTVFPDGSYETRYSNGRIRLKDKDGKLIVDSELHPGK